MQPLRFGDNFELDPGAYRLRRSGQTLRLERIPMEILLLLTQHRGQLVTREQIVERVWGKDVNLDVDNSINGAIRKIRQVLKDDPEHPRFIETVTGRGYRFVAPLRDSASTKVAPAVVSAPPPRPSRARLWLAPAAALLLLGGAATGAILVKRSRLVAPERRAMIAVLPFDNLTGDDRQEYFSDGLTEEMITQLGERDPEHLGVIARTSVMHYRKDRPPLERIARELGVQYILEGSVRRDVNQVRVTAQLIRATDQTQMWARQYDRKPADLLTLQDEIAEAIVNEIQSSLGRTWAVAPGDSVRSAHAFAAYDAYLKGEYFLNKRTVPDLERAIRYFEQATDTDSSYARAYAALADANTLLAGYSSLPPESLIAEARASALRALQLDPSLPEAHTAFALIVQNYDWDWQRAAQEFQRAIQLNPNYATAHHWYAEHLMWRGRFDEALRESERARRLDPLSLIIAADNGAILYFARQYDRAIDKWRSVLQMEPDFPRAHIIFLAYVEQGMYGEALADVEAQRPWLSVPVYWSGLVFINGRAGRMPEARHALQELLQSARRKPVQAGVIAWAYLSVGDKDQALAWLERAYAEHSNDMTALKVSPVYDGLRGDPRFQSLLERVGLAK
jgi:TolB-like protein/DNA-binding winged helix-turn-helix (wHTH) protein/Tfp pilus assembly protein PilF